MPCPLAEGRRAPVILLAWEIGAFLVSFAVIITVIIHVHVRDLNRKSRSRNCRACIAITVSI